MQPLLDALQSLGVECWSTRVNGCPPIVVRAGGFKGGFAEVRGDVSSQFITSLLIAAIFSRRETTLKVTGKRVSRPYVDATLRMIGLYGGIVEEQAEAVYSVPPSQSLRARDFAVPGDFSSAAFMAAAGALAGGSVRVKGINFNLPQADSAITTIAAAMGAKVSVHEEGGEFAVRGSELEGGSFDLSDSPDLLPVVAVMALKATKEVIISGVRHARFKETDRITVLTSELAKTGAKVKEKEDGLVIRPGGRLKKCVLDAHDDHRMFMAFCLAGLVSQDGMVVEGAESVDVSYPSFLQDLRSLGGRIEVTTP